jgi:hypothetical protein
MPPSLPVSDMKKMFLFKVKLAKVSFLVDKNSWRRYTGIVNFFKKIFFFSACSSPYPPPCPSTPSPKHDPGVPS